MLNSSGIFAGGMQGGGRRPSKKDKYGLESKKEGKGEGREENSAAMG